MYLDTFTLPIDYEEPMIQKQCERNGGIYGYIDNTYPCRMFGNRELYEISFKNVTIFYGGNGSGKSTLLNLIAQKLELNRIAPFNSSELFDEYVKNCEYSLGYDEEGFKHKIPDGSRIITSDDIFDYMLTIRTNNDEIFEKKDIARDEYGALKYGKSIRFSGMDDYEQFKMQVMSRRKSVSRRKFIERTAGKETELFSNGETALKYFETKLKNDKLYCLDEPENSMSAKMQLKLVKMLEEMSHYCGCQFIIATHSPFLLAMDNTKIYDLDSIPIEIKNWWELENTRIYYEFFKEHRNLFENNI